MECNPDTGKRATRDASEGNDEDSSVQFLFHLRSLSFTHAISLAVNLKSISRAVFTPNLHEFRDFPDSFFVIDGKAPMQRCYS